jgi:membrane-bound ClpP family serine protease
MMAIAPVIGVVLVLVGLALFLVDLNVTNHGLPTAGAILVLLAGGLVLLGVGVPYSGVLLSAVVVVSMLMGACSSGFCALPGPSEGGRPSPVKRG